jgi:sialate O-acetylesterase
MKSMKLTIATILLGFSLTAIQVKADVSMPAIFGNGMVLQRDKPIALWGKASAGEVVTVQFKSQTKKVTTPSNGLWSLSLSAEPAGGPYTLTLKGKNTLAFKDVLVGEVWICSGQSNMRYALKNSTGGSAEIAAAKFPKIRLFSVKTQGANTPLYNVTGSWKVCSPSTVPEFSAVGYLYGKKIHQSLNVPVGMIMSSLGGTFADAWIKESYWKADSYLKPIVEAWRDETNASRLYNGMIAPIIRYSIRGALWYQGEANTRRAGDYHRLLPTLIKCWRAEGKQGDFPFLYVQLPNCGTIADSPNQNSGWSVVRDAQLQTLSVANTGMAVTIDVGEKDIHPPNKKPVADRLAKIGLGKVYGLPVTYQSPLPLSVTRVGSKVHVKFSGAGTGLTTLPAGGSVPGFAIAGKDGRFVWATAQIQGDTVIVSSSKDPYFIRYAWNQHPKVNLYNKSGLPASPFKANVPR